MASFLAHGHPVDLYVYEPPGAPPAGVRLVDAEEILPRALLFTHRRTGSLGSFSDWFRYRLLRERGGIWAETLTEGRALRMACNHVMTDAGTRITEGCEVAFFPPVTGG